ncbi:MAG: 30S ribosomal protein S4 [Candidatus Saccharimonadales bacterium]
MARDRGSIVKMSRREGYALHPKAHKALLKRSSMPGQAMGGRPPRNKASQYSLQLREKQKVKRLYGLLEKQFSNLMKEAARTKGQSGTALLQFLELRLDNVVYRSGLAMSRRAARQLVTHGHFTLNGRRVDIPSIRVKIGDVITPRPHSLKTDYFKRIDDVSPASPNDIPGWIKVNRKKFEISVTGQPARENAEPDINEQLIVEYYSR